MVKKTEMGVNQVSVEVTLPDEFEDSLRAIIYFRPGSPESVHVYLPKTDLSIEHLRIIGDFIDKLTRFGDRAKELLDIITEK